MRSVKVAVISSDVVAGSADVVSTDVSVGSPVTVGCRVGVASSDVDSDGDPKDGVSEWLSLSDGDVDSLSECESVNETLRDTEVDSVSGCVKDVMVSLGVRVVVPNVRLVVVERDSVTFCQLPLMKRDVRWR